VLHAAIKSMEADGYEAMHPKQKKEEKPKPVNQIWENLYGIEEKNEKFEKDEKEFIQEDKPKVDKNKKVKQEEKVTTKFDEDSLTVYGALLSDSLDSMERGKEQATPQALIEKVISKEE